MADLFIKKINNEHKNVPNGAKVGWVAVID